MQRILRDGHESGGWKDSKFCKKFQQCSGNKYIQIDGVRALVCLRPIEQANNKPSKARKENKGQNIFSAELLL